MKAAIFFCILQGLSLSLAAQFTDDFSTGSLAAYWQGDTDVFTVTAGELQLSNTAPASNNTSALFTLVPTSTAASTSWSFNVRCAFAPSTSNFATIVLAADQPPTNGNAWRGYFLKVGGISGADDALELYRKDENGEVLLLAGTSGAVASDPVNLSVVIERSTAGEWALEADYFGGENYDPQGMVTDNTYTSGLYFGFGCQYTSTRNMAFFFDNVVIDPIVVDNEAPIAQSVSAQSANTIIVQYNEPLAQASGEVSTNYSLNNGIGTAQSVSFLNGDRTRLLLTFSNNLSNLTTYTLSLTDAEDLAGNVNPNQELSFEFLLPEVPAPGDLLITEIFPDPTPPVGLPDFEYIELYNASNKVLSLANLGLSTGSTPRTIDPFVMLPDTYVILCDQDAASALTAFGAVATLSSFPALTNGGDELILTDAEGNLLVSLTYDASWYQDPLRAEGGYAMELIDLTLPNDCPGNWTASLALAGGTPGQENSVSGAVLENVPPVLLTAFAPNTMEIVVRFDDVLDSGIDLTDFFTITPNIAVGAALLEPDRQSVRLFLSSSLAENTVYEISALSGLKDCIGNETTTTSSVQVGLTVSPEPGDLIINEVLFNPNTGGVDFLELYNPGNKILNLQGLRLRNEAITSGTLGTIVESNTVLLPGAYVVFTPDPANILQEYTVPQPAALVANSLPSMGDDEGNISVYNSSFVLLDALNYTEDWHSRLLSDRNGVSLERLRAEAITQSEGNWASAASTVGYGTPTGRNSQDRQSVIPPAEDFFVLPEKTFSPDEDGFQDVLEIQYSTDKAGYLARILIFDAQGRLVRQLEDLELLAGTGSFLWDGTTDDEQKARIGIYILVAEIFTTEGDTLKEKHTCVLAGKLD
ncbi:lamin tail domain-containing protein [Lewinella sp. LCG006]|uniref:lamin tail domain-containing protein n=1 Tax=Lewinella sp. LCG006 TaxID=3231911 RepID=UPI00345F249D